MSRINHYTICNFTLTLILLVLQVISKKFEKDVKVKNYLWMPFKTKILHYQNNNNKTNYNESNFLYDYFENPIFIDMAIGSPLQNITVEIDPNDSSFTFSQKQSFLDILKESENNKNVISLKPYNMEKSNTSIKKTNSSLLSYIAEDILYFKSGIINYKSNFDFNYNKYLANNTNVYCSLGINLDIFNGYSDSHFFELLKKNNILKKNLISFEFKLRYNGFLHIGPEPHFFDPRKYQEYKFIKTEFDCSKTNDTKNNTLDWKITFDEVDFFIPKNQPYEDDFQRKQMFNKTCIIDINSGIIVGTKEYNDLLDDHYFNNLIRANVCFKKIAKYKLKNYYVYSCDLDLVYSKVDSLYGLSYGFDVGLIPELFFIHNKLEYNFRLTFQDFFEEIGRMSYFKIVFEVDNNNTIWKLGQPFLYDYQFIFDIKNKTIGFYNPRFYMKEPKTIKEKEDIWPKIIKYSLFFGILLIFICIIFCFSIKYKKHKKKRINELEEDDKNYEVMNDKEENTINNNEKKEN